MQVADDAIIQQLAQLDEEENEEGLGSSGDMAAAPGTK